MAKNYWDTYQGGKQGYIGNQQDRFAQATKSRDYNLIGKLQSDAKKVGYSLPEFNPQQDYMDQINSIYDKQKEAQLGAYRAKRDQAVGQINQQKAELKPMYADKRNQADVVNAQNVSKLRELMAANGLTKSGENVTSQVALGSARQGALNQLNTQEQQQVNDFERRIADYMNPAEENAMLAQIEAQRAQAMADAIRYADETGYSRSRDSLSDKRYDNEWNYNVGRDKVSDGRYNNEWSYQKQRDALADQWRQKEWARNILESDRAFNLRKKSSGGGGGGGTPDFTSLLQQIMGNDEMPAFDAPVSAIGSIMNPSRDPKPSVGTVPYYNKMAKLFEPDAYNRFRAEMANAYRNKIYGK